MDTKKPKTNKCFPLNGIRIIDLTQAWAGTFATCLLADMGAEVIKIEARQRPDGWRGPLTPDIAQFSVHGYPNGDPGQKPYNRGALFHAVNRNKKAITVNLNSPEGIRIFKELVKMGDVVAENFTPRVMDNFGLGYDVLKQINKSIIMISMPGYGKCGPLKDSRGVGGTLEPMSGISSLMGYADGPPMNHGAMYPDPVAGMMGASAILIAIYCRKKTGLGQFIDLSQQETSICMLGMPIMDYSMNKRVWKRKGNHHEFMTPHQNYRCKGEDEWIAISVCSDEEWRRLVKAMGNPKWAEENKFITPLSRKENQDELDRYLEEWTVKQNKHELMRYLQQNNVAAGAVISPREVVDNPHLNARKYIVDVEYADIGPKKMTGVPWKMSRTPDMVWQAAPGLGRDSESIFHELLGISHEEYQHLVDSGITGEEPIIQA